MYNKLSTSVDKIWFIFLNHIVNMKNSSIL